MGVRGSFRGLGFNPGQLSKVSSWLRLAASSQSGGEWTSITDVLNSNPATFNAVRRSDVGASANALPLQTFVAARPTCMVLPTHASNNGTARWGMGFWLAPASVSGGNFNIYTARTVTGGTSADKISSFTFNTLLAVIAWDGAGTGRQWASASGFLALNTLVWVRIDYDAARSGDDRLRVYRNGIDVSSAGTYSAILGGSMPSALSAPTGNHLFGNFGDTTSSGAWGGTFGPNLYFFNADLTAAEELALMNFERPT